jgi:hypothetical protein
MSHRTLLTSCKLPVSLQDPLGNGIAHLVEHDFVISTAYEKLVLREKTGQSCKAFFSQYCIGCIRKMWN